MFRVREMSFVLVLYTANVEACANGANKLKQSPLLLLVLGMTTWISCTSLSCKAQGGLNHYSKFLFVWKKSTRQASQRLFAEDLIGDRRAGIAD